MHLKFFLHFFFWQVTKTELEKLKTSYRQLIKEMNSAKEKYKEAVAKGMAKLWKMFVLVIFILIIWKLSL